MMLGLIATISTFGFTLLVAICNLVLGYALAKYVRSRQKTWQHLISGVAHDSEETPAT